MMASLRGADFSRYREERRSAGRAENTIRLELALISTLYETAKKDWGMEGLIDDAQANRLGLLAQRGYGA